MFENVQFLSISIQTLEKWYHDLQKSFPEKSIWGTKNVKCYVDSNFVEMGYRQKTVWILSFSDIAVIVSVICLELV